MTNKNERMSKLTNAGVEIGKYFTLEVPEGLDAGTKIHIVFDESGVPQLAADKVNDPILSQIIEDGYVRNTKLFRRFVMAQMFHHLNYKSYNGKYSGYNDCINKSYGYDYTFRMMLEEVKVLSKLEERDKDTFAERSHFFTKDVVVATMEDYMDKLKAYIDSLPSKSCKGVPYKRIKGKNIFNVDIDKKIYAPLRRNISRMKSARNYKVMHSVLSSFMRDMIKLPYDTPKSKAWFDAYKGEGAFYTLKNLIMYHDCLVFDKAGDKFNGGAAMFILNNKLEEYKGEGWRMFALMKKVIADNDIDTKTHIGKVCNYNK